MASIDEILAAASDETARREAVAKVLLRQDLAQRHEQLDAELQEAMAAVGDRVDRPEHVRELAEQVKALEDEIEAALIPVKFRAVSFKDWSDLLKKHPPTKQQRDQNQYIDHDPDTFPFAAMAASAVDPVMTVEQAKQLQATLPPDQWLLLWGTCAQVCRGDGGPKVSRAAGLILRTNGKSAAPATTTESDALSS